MEEVSNYFSPWHLWVIAAVILAIGELVTPGFFLLSIAAGCLLAAVASAFLGLNGQLIFLIIGAFCSFFVLKRYAVDRGKDEAEMFGIEGLVGQMGKVVEEVSIDSGYVKVGGETWPARIESGTNLGEGEQVKVVRSEGNKLIVTENG